VIRLTLFIVLLFASTAAAVQPDEQLKDPTLEARARTISAGLRCLVCQNQSIDDSEAPLARDLRLLVRKRLLAGDSDDAARDYLVARYGDFVLLKPPFQADTVLLWSSPFIVLLIGLGIAAVRFRRPPADTPPLSEAEEMQLAAIVSGRAGAEAPPRHSGGVTEN
jgi:cytochrome c-type biogenesis protein CcmH